MQENAVSGIYLPGCEKEKFMAGQPLLTHSPRHIAGDVIYCGMEFIEVLLHSTQRHPKKPISHQVRQIYGDHWQRGSGSAAQGGSRLLGREALCYASALALHLHCFQLTVLLQWQWCAGVPCLPRNRGGNSDVRIEEQIL